MDLKDDIFDLLQNRVHSGLEQKVGHCHSPGDAAKPRQDSFDPFIPCTGQPNAQNLYALDNEALLYTIDITQFPAKI
jgi:hypothetical protein